MLGKSWSKDILFNYSSGGVHTRKDYDLRNNMYLELRCKLPQNNAGYSSFWTVSRKVGDWKPEDLLEIDMFEFIAALKKPDYGVVFGGMILGPMNFMMVYPREVM